MAYLVERVRCHNRVLRRLAIGEVAAAQLGDLGIESRANGAEEQSEVMIRTKSVVRDGTHVAAPASYDLAMWNLGFMTPSSEKRPSTPPFL